MIVGAAVAVLVLLVMAHSSYFVAVDAVGGVLELAGPVVVAGVTFRSCHASLQSWFFTGMYLVAAASVASCWSCISISGYWWISLVALAGFGNHCH